MKFDINGYASIFLAMLSFAMFVVTMWFSVDTKRLLEKHGHWVKPLLFTSSIMWFMTVFLLLGSCFGRG